MKTFLKVAGALVALLILGIICVYLLFLHERSKYSATAVPFIQKIVPEIAAHWDPDVAKGYMAPQITASVDPQEFQKIFKAYNRLGALKTLGEPVFLQIWADSFNGTIVAYTVPATFDAGSATITIRLVDTGHGFQIYLFRIDSMAFLQ